MHVVILALAALLSLGLANASHHGPAGPVAFDVTPIGEPSK